MKKLSLVILVACAFLVGYAAVAEAWPVYDREKWMGYFLNTKDVEGPAVWDGGIPDEVNTAEEFIKYTKDKLASSDRHNSTGAGFIIQTMIGDSRYRSPQPGQIAEWEQRVRYADAKGWIDWSDNYSYLLNSYYQGGGKDPDDDAFFEEPKVQVGHGITFRGSDGNIKYQLKRNCANPTGVVSPIDDRPDYTITGRSTVTANVVSRGDRVTFRHFLRNRGTANSTINWQTEDTLSGVVKKSGSHYIAANREVEVNALESFIVPNNATNGTQYCRKISFNPQDGGLGSGEGSPVCAVVNVDYSLNPLVSSSSSVAQPGDSLTFTYKIQINGSPGNTNVVCKAVGASNAPGYNPLPRQNADRGPEVVLSPPLDCGNDLPDAVLYTAGTETVSVGALSPGSRICRSLTLSPRDRGGGFVSSAEACVVIAKTPLSHFMGNDVWAGGNFESVDVSCSGSAKINGATHGMSDGTVAGSGVEYAAFALGNITNFGSENKALESVMGKALSFANIDSNLGNYGAAKHCIDDYVSKYSSAPIFSNSDVNVADRASGAWKLPGNHNIYGNMPAGAQQVYLVEGDATITGNITYAGSYADASKIPSLVLIATGKITVDSSVNDISGLFVARTSFDTCNPPIGFTPSVSNCNTQLVINGAVKAGKINLLRNFGADGASVGSRKQPAEIFRFNSEMYIQSALSGNDARTLKTIDQKDLPPRF